MKVKNWYGSLIVDMDEEKMIIGEIYKTFEPAFRVYKKHDACIALFMFPRLPDEDDVDITRPCNVISMKKLFSTLLSLGIIEVNPCISTEHAETITEIIQVMKRQESLDDYFANYAKKHGKVGEDQKQKKYIIGDGNAFLATKLKSQTIPFHLTDEQIRILERHVSESGFGEFTHEKHCIDRSLFYTDKSALILAYHNKNNPTADISWRSWQHPEFQDCPEVFGFENKISDRKPKTFSYEEYLYLEEMEDC